MDECLKEATAAAAKGEVPVGAVVISASGEIIGKGGNSSIQANDPSAHAEIVALRNAAERLGNYRLEGCVLAVTLEPCLMCLGAMTHARIAGLVYGAEDPKAGCVTSCLDGPELPFLNHAFWHMGRIKESECSALLSGFFEKKRVAE